MCMSTRLCLSTMRWLGLGEFRSLLLFGGFRSLLLSVGCRSCVFDISTMRVCCAPMQQDTTSLSRHVALGAAVNNLSTPRWCTVYSPQMQRDGRIALRDSITSDIQSARARVTALRRHVENFDAEADVVSAHAAASEAMAVSRLSKEYAQANVARQAEQASAVAQLDKVLHQRHQLDSQLTATIQALRDDLQGVEELVKQRHAVEESERLELASTSAQAKLLRVEERMSAAQQRLGAATAELHALQQAAHTLKREASVLSAASTSTLPPPPPA